jgi:uncharacterized hydrophobic protein (TIGR00271 family)
MQDRDSPLGPIRYSQNLSLWQAMTRGLGVMIATIILVLLGTATTEAGPLVPAAILLTTLLVMLNGLGYAELAAGSSRLGGAYALVHVGTGSGSLCYLTGWASVLAGLGLCGLLAQGAGHHLALLASDLLGVAIPAGLLGMALTALVMLETSLGGLHGRRSPFTVPLLILLAVLLLLAAPRLPQAEHITTSPQPNSAIALLMAAFVGIEVITGHQREIHRRTANLPRALLLTPALTALVAIGVAGVMGPIPLLTPQAPLAPLGEAIANIPGRAATLGAGSLILILAMARILRTIVRLLYVMGQDGFWPRWLWQAHSKRGTPIPAILSLGSLIMPIVWVPGGLVGRVCGLLYLLVLMAVNWTLARRPQNQKSSFKLPFHPWVPALAIAVDALVTIPLWGLVPVVCVAGALLVGIIVYLAYARGHHIESQEGVIVFRPPAADHAAERYRILVPIANPDTAATLLRVAGRLAEFNGGEALALQVVVVPETVPLEAGQQRAKMSQAILEKALAIANAESLPLETMTRAARSVGQGILDTAVEEKVDMILLGWQGPTHSRDTSLGRIADTVLRDAPCDVLIMRGEHAPLPKTILVPTAGGPHASAAARLATLMMKALQAKVTLAYIQPQPTTAKQIEEDRHRIAEMVEDLSITPPPTQKVIQAPSVVEGIVQEAQDHDLVLLGVSEESLLDRVVFGSVPLQVAVRVKAAALVQGYQGVTRIWTRRLLQALRNTLPVLGREERLEVQLEIGRGAQPGVNFFVLIFLSCIMASLGLLLNSSAIVIGAMLVGPLMTPIMAFSVGLVTGNLRAIRFSTEAILKGVALVVIISASIGLLSPLKTVTDVMMANSQPNLLDLAVALVSGMAGAYALARKDVSAALPGVAVAAALTPPLATMGLSLAMGNVQVAGGAFLLFVTNIAAISLAAGVVFLLLGIRPRDAGAESRKRLRQRLIASLFLLAVVAVPLGVIMAGIVQDTTQEQAVRETITQHLDADDGQLVALEIEQQQETLLIVATVRSSQVLDEEAVNYLAERLSEHLKRPIHLEVVTLPVVRSIPTRDN